MNRDLSVVVIGNSMPLALGPVERGRPVGGKPYPYLLERELRARGIDATVHLNARPGQVLSRAIPRMQEDVFAPVADVVIMQFVGYEAFSSALPEFLRQYLHTNTPRLDVVSRALRRSTIGISRAALLNWQRTHGKVLGVRGGRRSPQRFRREVAQALSLIDRFLDEPHVILLSQTPFGGQVERAMPGVNARIRGLNEVLRTMADERGARCDYIDVAALVDLPDPVSSDHLHLAADGHTAVSRILADRIVERLDQRDGAQ